MELRSIILLAGAVSASLSIFVGFYALEERKHHVAAIPFSLLLFTNALYSLADGLSIASGSPLVISMCLKARVFGPALIPVFWFLFSRFVAHKREPLSHAISVILFIIPFFTILLTLTTGSHGLMIRDFRGGESTTTWAVAVRYGPWYTVHVVYSYTLMILGSIGIVHWLIRGGDAFSGRSASLLTIMALSWGIHLAITLTSRNLDVLPLLVSISGALFGSCLFRFGPFFLAPIARDLVLDTIKDGVIVLDKKSRVVDANRAALKIFPSLVDHSPGMDGNVFLKPFGIPVTEGESGFSLELEEGTRYYKTTTIPIFDDRVDRGMVVLISDATEATELLTRLGLQASTDELTQIGNRRRFFEHARRELALASRRRSSLSFAMFDLDHFKRINDSFGHAAGDAALVSICRVCQDTLRSTDILCRFGGEEFMIILPDADPQSAEIIVERVRRRIEETPISAETGTFSLTASFGLSGSFGPPSRALELYLKDCDTALYRAKDGGRNRVIVHEGPSREGLLLFATDDDGHVV